jgi:hypothetical protein
MSAPPILTVLTGGCTNSFPPAGPRSRLPDSWNLHNAQAVEIVAPDHYCATLLLDYGSASFRAEIIPGPGWIVRFHPPAADSDWVTRLLALVETWLRGVPLPCAKVRHGNRHYLVRAPNPPSPAPPAPGSAA